MQLTQRWKGLVVVGFLNLGSTRRFTPSNRTSIHVIQPLRFFYRFVCRQDGSAALSPSEIRPPDDWEWISEWKIDRSGERDVGGWEYSKETRKFDSSRGETLMSALICLFSLECCIVNTKMFDVCNHLLRTDEYFPSIFKN